MLYDILLLVFLAFISIILPIAIFVLSIIVVYLWCYLVYQFICLNIILVSSLKVKSVSTQIRAIF